MNTLNDVLVNGRLGAITFGMSVGEVIGVVGQPDDRLGKSLDVLKYGPLELAFLKAAEGAGSGLATINCYFGRGDRHPEWLDAGEWLVSESTTVGQFREYLQSINLRVRSEIPGTPTEYLITYTGVRAAFVNGRLQIIHATKESHTSVAKSAPKESETSAETSARMRPFLVAVISKLLGNI